MTENLHREEAAGLTSVKSLASYVCMSDLWRHTPARLMNTCTCALSWYVLTGCLGLEALIFHIAHCHLEPPWLGILGSIFPFDPVCLVDSPDTIYNLGFLLHRCFHWGQAEITLVTSLRHHQGYFIWVDKATKLTVLHKLSNAAKNVHILIKKKDFQDILNYIYTTNSKTSDLFSWITSM